MVFDYKKEYKEFYMPKNKPAIVTIPKMNYIAVRGKGNPNDEGGEYQRSIELLYGIAYTIKMSYKSSRKIKGFFEYIVPPLEGFWWQNGSDGMDYGHKENFKFISIIRLPDFVTKEDLEWAIERRTFQRWIFLPMKKAIAFNACTSALMITNPKPSTRWKNTQMPMDMRSILPILVIITKFIFPIHANVMWAN